MEDELSSQTELRINVKREGEGHCVVTGHPLIVGCSLWSLPSQLLTSKAGRRVASGSKAGDTKPDAGVDAS